MSPWIISLMVAVGASTWIYTKLQKYSGNNTKQSTSVAILIGLVLFGVILSILSLIL